MADTVYSKLARTVNAYQRCKQTGNAWALSHEEHINKIVRDFLPHGSGWDCGTSLSLEHSTDEKLVLFGSFHHMNDTGMYDGWTEHTITVRPSLMFGITLSISGRNRNDIKDYLHEMFDCSLRTVLDYDASQGRFIAQSEKTNA